MDDPFLIQNQDNTIRDNRIEDYYDKSLEGGFLFGGKEAAGSLRLSVNRKKIIIFFGVIIFCLGILFLRIFYLQAVKGSYYRDIAEGNRVRIKPIRATRGVVTDRNGHILVRNVPRFSLFFIPADLPDDRIELNRILGKVANILDKSILELEKLVDEAWEYSYEPVSIAEEVPYEQAVLLSIESASGLPGIFLETAAKRQYLETESGLAPVIGYTGKLTLEEYEILSNDGYLINDYLGKTGVERVYEKILRGEYGKKKVEVDSMGKEERVLSALESKRGQDLILSIDLDLQKKVLEVLTSRAPNHNAAFRQAQGSEVKGAVILTEVKTGQILALASVPSYDNNLFALGIESEEYQALTEDESKPLFNRVISGEYPPGSTFKLVEAAGALEDKIIDEKTHVFSTGGIRVGEWFFPDWKYGGHGRVTVTKAIAESVNTFFYYIGGGYEEFRGLGIERINYWAYLFGIGQKLGIDLVGEDDGFLPTKQWKLKYKNEPWYIGDTYHVAIGQGDILVTPLQVNVYTAAIANGGILYGPRVALGYIDTVTQARHLFKPEIIRQNFVAEENLALVREGMRDAVIYGSSRRLSGLNVKVAGKTGTAQVGGEAEPHAWFTGFAPYDKPEVAITVLVENGGEGSSVAVPIAYDILEYYFK